MSEICFYQSIVDQTSVGYSYNKIIYDDTGVPVDYQFIAMNSAYESMIGIQEKNWLGKGVGELYQFINEEPVNWEEYHRHILAKQMKRESDLNFKHLGKHYRIKIHSPKKDHIIISLTDISVEVGETEKLWTLFDSVPIQVWYLKDSRTYLSANEAHADFLGFNREDLVKMDIKDMVSSESATICINGNKAVFRQKEEVVTEESLSNPQEEERLLRITKNPKLNSKGEIKFVICSAEDITDDYWNKRKKEVQERILCSSINFMQELMTNSNLEEALVNGIEMLGNVTKVDRVYFWENHYDEETKQLLTRSKIEWYLDEHERVATESKYQDVYMEEFTDFIAPLAKNESVSFHTKDLDETSFTKEFLESQRIYSVLTIPVFLKDNFVGFIGFDSYNQEREWSEIEISLLNSFVLLYEKALERAQLEQEIKQKNDNLFNFFICTNYYAL